MKTIKEAYEEFLWIRQQQSYIPTVIVEHPVRYLLLPLICTPLTFARYYWMRNFTKQGREISKKIRKEMEEEKKDLAGVYKLSN